MEKSLNEELKCEILNLHRQVAEFRLTALQFEQRLEMKNRECSDRSEERMKICSQLTSFGYILDENGIIKKV